MKLYVGNLSYNTTEDTLRECFSNYGDVVSVQIMKDRFTQQSKGFAFVEMATEIMGERGIGGMNGKEVDGRRIRVTVAVEKGFRPAGERKFSDKDGFRPRRGRFNHDERDDSNRDEYRKSSFHRDDTFRPRHGDSENQDDEYRPDHSYRERGERSGEGRGRSNFRRNDFRRGSFSKRERDSSSRRDFGGDSRSEQNIPSNEY
ncbi:hypothetical protein [uncultured Treponema sp.]|uniref:hypothetical protein n=1 Tax=uncultured Treponema sp. TaxID=162155 RepID=UPI00345DFFDE